jgi:hypothetical protein
MQCILFTGLVHCVQILFAILFRKVVKIVIIVFINIENFVDEKSKPLPPSRHERRIVEERTGRCHIVGRHSAAAAHTRRRSPAVADVDCGSGQGPSSFCEYSVLLFTGLNTTTPVSQEWLTVSAIPKF